MENTNQPKDSDSEIPKSEKCRLSGCPEYGKHNRKCESCGGPVTWKDERNKKHGKTRSCHNCPNNGLGLPVCWAACPGPNTGFITDGKCMVTLGSLEDEDAFIANEREDKGDIRECGDSVIDAMESEPDDRRKAFDSAITNKLSAEAETACKVVFATVMSLDETDLRIFYHLYRNCVPTKVADKVGITKQAVSRRMHRMARDNKWMASFIKALNLKHAGGGGSNRGKVDGGSMFQPDLFAFTVMNELKTDAL